MELIINGVYETNEHEEVKIIYLQEVQPVVLLKIWTEKHTGDFWLWGKPRFIKKSHLVKFLGMDE